MNEVILYAGNDGQWIAECPDIPGCTSRGNTKAQALTNMKNAIHQYAALRPEKIPLLRDIRFTYIY